MIAAIGACLMASAIVVFAWAYGQYRRPAPARWTVSEGITVALVMVMISLLAFGFGMIVRAALNTDTLSMGAFETAIMVSAFAAAFALVPPLTRPARAAQAIEPVVPIFTGTAAAMPPPANEPGPTPPARPAGGGGKSGKPRRVA
jgi:hypothetical protein